MFMSHLLVATLGFALLLPACGEDTLPPSGPRTEPVLRPAARVSRTALERTGFQSRGISVNALFDDVNPSECVRTSVSVFGAEQALKEGPGNPTTGTLAFVQVLESNFCTGEELRSITGSTLDATFQGDNQLTEARLQATILAPDFVNEEEVQVVVDLVWTEAGELLSLWSRFRIREAGVTLTESVKGTFRPADVSGTVSVGGENLGTDAPDLAEIRRARSGVFELVRTR